MSVLSAPFKDPTGVRDAATMTTSWGPLEDYMLNISVGPSLRKKTHHSAYVVGYKSSAGGGS